MKSRPISSFAAAILLLNAALAIEPKREAIYRGTVKNLAPAPTVLGEEWVEATGIVIEDFADLLAHPAQTRPVVEGLRKQMEPLGVRKAADFSFRVPDEPLRYVILRVFIFETPELCEQWWEKKYRHDGWDKFYKPVDGVAYSAVDSTELPKRAAAIGNVWMTCQSTKDPGDHLPVINACVEKLLEATKAD